MTDENQTAHSLIETIKDDIANSLQQFLFEPNNPATWTVITEALTTTLSKYELQDYVVICDKNNNSENVSSLQADIAVRLPGYPDFIYLPTRIESIQR